MTQGGREGRRPAPLSELVDDVSADELSELERIDGILRSVPGPPPALPPSLRHPPPPREPVRLWTRRRVAVAVAFAAALSALFFGLGTRFTGGDDFNAQAAIPMDATKNATGASAMIKLGAADASGNRTLRLRVSGLKPLPDGGYYVLWLAKDGDYAATCGTFSVGPGETDAEWTVSYRLRDYDAWVVTARLPNAPRQENPPWLLKANI
jgi:hypothetical protein